MNERARAAAGRQATEEEDEALLARCIERFAEVGAAAVEELAGGDGERAQRLHARLAALERLGLLAGQGAGAAPLAIGPYRLLDFLGQGGMGAVYLVLDERRARNVALKLCHAPLAPAKAGEVDGALARSRARFEREIRAAAQLEHPGIVSIFDVGESAGRAYFTMELVEGATLARIVEELHASGTAFESITPDTIRAIVAADARPGAATADPEAFGRTYVEAVCRWTIEIAEALAHAHAHGIVHRDVKPSNVMVQPDGHAKLFDLGLARVSDQPGLTRSGDLAGSPYYMSPEQVAGAHERVDQRTDVYSLGVTLFELLTLRRPFEGPTSARVFQQIAGREPPLLRRLNPLVPRDLETVCLTALEKDPERRYPSMEELAADLRRFLSFQPVRAKPASAARKTVRFVRRNPALASALGLAALVLVGLPIGLLWANSAIRAEERRAAREARLKSQVTDFLIEQFALTEAEREQGATISARELLDRGAERVESEFEDDLLVRGELLASIGRVYANLGLHERAVPLLDRALAIRQSLDEQDPAALAALLDDLAAAHLAGGEPETARRICERGLALLAGSSAAGLTQARLLRTHADAARSMGDLDEAQRSLTRALAIQRGAPAQPRASPAQPRTSPAYPRTSIDELETATVLERLGTVALARGEPAQAGAALEEALVIQRRAWSPDLGALARLLDLLARVHDARGEPQQADARRLAARRYLDALAPAPPPSEPLPRTVAAPFQAEFDEHFQRGISALQARELERSIAAFTRCLALDPGHSVSAYNVACCHALAGEVEQALVWLERAVELGFGVLDHRLRVAETDPEIAALRADPRGAALLVRMQRHAARVRAFAAEPALYEPPARDGALLVVLHAGGATKLDVVRGPWRTLADELGATLLAPSGSIATGAEPELGLDWFEDERDLVRRQSECERSVLSAIRAYAAQHPLEDERVWIAGEGSGATVAFDVALRSPGLFAGVVLCNGTLHPDTPVERARVAAALGLRVVLATDTPALAASSERWLREQGFDSPEMARIERGDARTLTALLRDPLTR